MAMAADDCSDIGVDGAGTHQGTSDTTLHPLAPTAFSHTTDVSLPSSWFAPRKGLYVYNDRGATAAAASRKVLSRVAAAARRNVAAQREAARRRGEYDSGEEGEEGGGPGRRSGGSRYASSYDLATYSQGLLSTTAQALDEGRGPLGSEAAFARNGSGPGVCVCVGV